MATQVHSKISKAKARLLIDYPFFAHLLLRTPVEITDQVPLAATDGNRIFYNPDFLDLCSVDDVMCVLAHEAGGHNALLHSLRIGGRNPDIANQAMDHAINLMLEDQGFRCPKMVPGGWLADPQYKGMNWEKIYDHLRREPPPPQDGQGGGSGPNRQPQQNAQDGKPGMPQPGKDWLHGDVLPSPSKDPAERAEAEQTALQRVASAATAAKLAGKYTGELARMVDEFLGGTVPWHNVLREFMLRIVRSRENWTRRNRRFSSVYLPTRRERSMGPIVFIPDTSGSMWCDDDLEKCCSEIACCAEQTRPEHIRVVWADTCVKGEQVFEADEFSFAKLEPKGGGGTDMTVPLKYVEKYDPQVVVLCTDGETPWPSREPDYPLIVLCTTNANCPIGQVIRI